MKNPFSYSNIVTGDNFCNRQKEQTDLLDFIRSSQNVLLYSHRRTGKSSLIQQLFLNVNQQAPEIATLYVDLYGTTSEKDFILRVFQQLHCLESNTDKLLKLLKNSMDRFSFQISIDPVTHLPAITPAVKSSDETVLLKNLMELLEKFSHKKQIVIALDEFQEVAKYANAASFEKQLRSFIQHQPNICYIFSGSQQHLLTAMFQSQDRAFYQQAASYPLPPIQTNHFIPWLTDLFAKGGLGIDQLHLETMVQRLDNQPMYIQLFCFYLWQELQTSDWTDQTLEKIERRMIDQKHLEYQILWDSLSINQKKTLKLILINDGKNLFSAQSLTDASIKTASIVTRCLKSLSEKEIIVKNGKYIIQDLFFKKWLSLSV